MYTFFISTHCKKDLQRIKKILIRNCIVGDKKDYTVNSPNLFIVCYYHSTEFDYWTKRQVTENGAKITTVNLHTLHPKLKENVNENLTPLPFAQ